MSCLTSKVPYFFSKDWIFLRIAISFSGLASKLFLVVGDRDKAVPVKVARKVQALVPGTELHMQVGLGHLSHEEAPGETGALIAQLARSAGVLEGFG